MTRIMRTMKSTRLWGLLAVLSGKEKRIGTNLEIRPRVYPGASPVV